LLVVLLGEQPITEGYNRPKLYSCSGCPGLIKLRQVVEGVRKPETMPEEVPLDAEKQELLGKIIDCPLFRTVSTAH